jgi:hypothetical protein
MIQIGIIENTQHFLYQIEKYQLAVFFFILTVFIYLNPDFWDSSSWGASDEPLKPSASSKKLIAFRKSNNFYSCFFVSIFSSSFSYYPGLILLLLEFYNSFYYLLVWSFCGLLNYYFLVPLFPGETCKIYVFRRILILTTSYTAFYEYSSLS